MKNKKYIILIICIIALFSMQFVSASDNTDIDVLADANDDGILLAPTETKHYADLKDLIDSANDGDEISLEYNYKWDGSDWQNPDPKSGINITKNLIINGNGAVIDGASSSSLFNISEGVTVTLKNLTIKNAAYKEGWSAQDFKSYSAIVSKGTLNIENCTFEGIKPAETWMEGIQNANGSVIYSTADVNILNSVFADNCVATSSIIYTTGSVSVKGSTFKDNIAYGDDFKGAVIYTEGGIDLIDDCIFEGNGKDGKGSGGVIYIANSDAVTSIKGSTFDFNYANNGGVIYTEGIIETIEDSDFWGDMAFIGAVVYAKAVNTIDNSYFDTCGYYTDTSKGAIYITGNNDLIVTDSTFTGGMAGEGCAIYTHGGVSLIDCEISENHEDSYSVLTKGAVYANGDVYIERTSITDNFAMEGAAIYTNSSVTIKDCDDIQENGVFEQHVTSKGGVIYAKGDVDVIGVVFGPNYVDVAGGAIYSESNVNFYNSSVNGSAATKENGDGGFIYAEGNVNVENSTISDVYMKVNDQRGDYSGAVFAEGDMTIRNATFDHINKDHHSYGGAIRVLGNVAIYNSNFTNNQAMLYAAGYVDGTLDVYDCIFTNNSDGAIFSEGNAIVNNTIFINNTISGSTMYGIAIGSNGTLNFTNSRATGSSATGANYRGSVFSKDDLYVENCTFDEIHSQAGTATGMIISTKSNATIINTKFSDFSYHGSTIYGGSVYAGVNAYVENCTFINATLIDQDGQTHGLCIYAEDNISLYNSTLKDIDSSNGKNGAVKCGNYVYVFNSTFTNITGARSDGGAIYANVANVTNSSFYRILCSDNSDKGGAIYANDTYAYYNNFTDCHAGIGGAIYSLNYTTAIENIFINNSNQYSGGAIYTKNGFIQYNVILENMGNTWNLPADIAIADSEVDSLEYNWWGENDPFGTEDKQKRVQINVQSQTGTYFLPDTWVRMHFFVTDHNQPIIGEGVNLTTTLKHYYNRTTDSEYDLGHNIAKRTVIYKANTKTADENVGWFSHDTAPIINQDYVLYSNNNFLKHNVSSTIDYQTLYLDVAQCAINVTKTVTNTTPNVGDEIEYTITVSNIDLTDYTDPNRVILQHPEEISIELSDILDKRLRFISANDTNYNPETGLWSFDLPWNKTVSLTIKVNVRGSGNITNYANITKINNTDVTPYGANITIEVNQSDIVILDVNKSANTSSVVVGDLVKFTITVNNTGTINATNVNITDELNEAFEFVSATRGGTNSSNLVAWTIDKLDVGQPVSVEVVVRVLKAGNFTNTAFANSTENKTKTNGTSDNVTVSPFVNLTVNKAVNVTVDDVVLVGDKLKYTIIVKNNGLSVATDVDVVDVVDSGLVEVIAGESSSGYGSVVANGWRVDSLAVGASETFILVVKVVDAGTIVNTVVVNSSENKTPVTNKSIDVDADPFVKLTISKVANVTSAVVGDNIKFTITIRNSGLSDATGVNVWDILPETVRYVSGADSYDVASRNASWTIAEIEAGKSAEVYVIVNVTAAGNLSNTAFANSSENGTVVNKTSDNVTVDPNVVLSISKVANVTSAVVGDNIKFTITIRNSGLSDATGVNVWDILPETVRYVSGADSYNVDSRNASWTIDSIAAGHSEEVVLVVNVTAAGNLSNTAFANSSENGTVVNKTSDNVTVIPNVELVVTKSVDVTSVKVGDKVTFTITVANNGKSDATNVLIYDILDSEFIYVSGGSYDADTRNVTWIIPTIAAGKSANRSVVVTVKSEGNYSNIAFANSDENKTLVNGSSENVTVNPNVGLVVIKTASANEVKVGENITFTITVLNDGESDATNVVISDILNNAFEWKAGGNYDRDTRNVTWTISNIPKHDSASVTVVVTALNVGNFTNVASVFSDENKTPVNDSTDNITISPDVRLSMIKVAGSDVVKVGENVTFTITVTNNGKSNATNVVICDILSDAFEYASGADNYDKDSRNATWTITNIAAGNSTSVTLILTAKLAGNYSNIAFVSSNENKTPTNASSDNITVNPDVRLSMTKSSDVTSLVVGNNVTFTIVVTNNGKSNATNVIVSDVLNDAFLWKSGGNYDEASRNVTWTISNITSGKSATVTLVVTAMTAGNYSNVAFVNSDENVTKVNASSENITIIPNIELILTKEANASEVKVGDNITFTIIITNNGKSDAANVTVSDVLGEEFGYVSSNGGVYDNDTRTVVWNIDKIEAGNSTKVTIVVTALTDGKFNNTAVAKSKDNDTEVNGSSDNITIVPYVKLDVVKDSNVSTVKVGEYIRFSITVTNNGKSDATNVRITDKLEEAFGYVNSSEHSGKDGNLVHWDIDSIAAGESVTVYVVVNATKEGTYANNATAISDENTTESNSTKVIVISDVIILNVTKVADISAVKVGDNIKFTITISNIGTDDATDVVITDVLGEEFSYVESSNGGIYNNTTRKVTWTIPSIAVRNSTEVYVIVTALTNGTFDNTAVANAKENKTNVTATSDNVTVNPDVKLDINKTADVNHAVVGDEITFTIVVKNNGLSDATGVVVSDVLDKAFAYVSGGSYDAGSRTVTWIIDSIAAKSSETVTLVVKVMGNGTFANTVVAVAEENETEVTNTSDNITVDPNVELGVVKVANVTSAVVGDNIEFTIVVTNNGLSDATGVKVTDVLDEAFAYVSGGSYDSGSRTVTWTIDCVAAKSSETVTLVVAVLSAGSVSNNVSVISKENDTEVTNSSDDIPVTPNVELSIVKVANVTSTVVGDLIKYTITVKNDGLSDARDVNVWDILPETVRYVSGADAFDVSSRNATWTIASIAAGHFEEVVLVVNLTSAGNLSNTAFANSSENDTVVNKTSDNVTVVPNVELGVVKVANVTSAVVGDNIEFTIIVTNNGLSDATDVVVSDVLDEAFAYVSGGNYNLDTREVSWTIDCVAANSSETVTLVVAVLSAGSVSNNVSVISKENDTEVTNSSDDIPVTPNVELSIVKVANVTSAVVGDSIKFTITIKNSGLSDATNVEIEDILPESVKFVSANGTYVNDGQNVKWTLDKVEGNSSVSVYVIVSAVSNGSAVNFANVTCSENSTANTTSDEIEVKPVVNLTVVKTANVSEIYVGDKVSYNIVVTNNGPSNASNVIVVDELPNGLKFVSSNVDCVVVDNKATWSISELTVGENLTIEVVCIAVGSGDLTNTVNVTCDENKTNTTGGTPIHVSDIVDVAIELSVDKTNPDINDGVIITLKVRNNGPSNATGIVGKLNKDFLNGLKIISIDSDEIKFATSDLLGYSLSDILKVNENGDFSIDYLNANQEVSATIKATVIRDGNITVDGTVSSQEEDSNLTNNYDEITMSVHSLVDLSVSKTVSNMTPIIGDTIEYVIVVVNAGPSNATGVSVNEKLPDGVVFISDDAKGAYDHNTGVWTIDSINANETRTLTIKVQVTSVGQITNNVEVLSNEENTNVTGSKTNVTIDVQPAPKVDLEVLITSNTTKTDLGDLVEFTITVINKGTTNASGVTVKDILPDGLQYVSDDGNGTYNPGNGLWTVAELDAGNNKVLHIIAKTTKAGNVTNTVSVDSDQEILDVNSTVASITVEVVEHKKPIENASDNAPAKVDTKETGNPFVLLAMALLFAGVGLRRRKE